MKLSDVLRTNSKLKKDGIVTFDLPAVATCPGAGSCKEICYACKGWYRLNKDCRSIRQWNLQFSRSKSFVDIMVMAVQRSGAKLIRLHSTGDFYSQSYLNKWVTIARRCPEVTFYCYTKSLHLDWSAAKRLPNFRVRASFGGKWDHLINTNLPHAQIFDTDDQLTVAGYLNGSNSDLIGASKQVRVGLVKH